MNEYPHRKFIQQLFLFLSHSQQTFFQNQNNLIKILEQKLIQYFFIPPTSLPQQSNPPKNVKIDKQKYLNQKQQLIESLDIKLLVQQLNQSKSRIKYPVIVLVVFILLSLKKNNQKGFSSFLSYYYEILSLMISDIKNQSLKNKKIVKTNQVIQKQQLYQTIYRFGTGIFLRMFQGILINTNSSFNNQSTHNEYQKFVEINFKYLNKHFFPTFKEQKSNSTNKLSSNLKQPPAIKPSKITKIITSLFCLPQNILSHEKIINLIQKFQHFYQDLDQTNQIMKNIEYKMIKKLQQYQNSEFKQNDIINLMKILLYRVDKDSIQDVIEGLLGGRVTQINVMKDKSRGQANDNNQNIHIFTQSKRSKLLIIIKKLFQYTTHLLNKDPSSSNSFGYHIICFLISTLSKSSQFHRKSHSFSLIKQVIYFISINFFSLFQESSFSASQQSSGTKQTIKFYNNIISSLIKENNIFILKICLSFIENYSISHFSVHKLKSLFKLLTEISKKLEKIQSFESRSNKEIKSPKKQKQTTKQKEKQKPIKLRNEQNEVAQSTKLKGYKKVTQQALLGQKYNQILINQEVELAKLKISRILKIIEQLTQQYKEKTTQLYFQVNQQKINLQKKLKQPKQQTTKCFLRMQKIKNSYSMYFSLKMEESNRFQNAMVNNPNKSQSEQKTDKKSQKKYINLKSQDDTFIKLFQFVMGKTQNYIIKAKITPSNSSSPSMKQQKTIQNKSLSQQSFFNHLLSSQPQYCAQILVYLQDKIVFKDQIQGLQKIASSFFQFNVVVTCNKSTTSKGTTIFIKINEKLLITIESKLKKNQITALEFGFLQYKQNNNNNKFKNHFVPKNLTIKKLFLLNKQIPSNIFSSKYDHLLSAQFILQTLQQLNPSTSNPPLSTHQKLQQFITYRIDQTSEQLIQNLKKQQGFFFKKQLRLTSQNIHKRRSTSFTEIFKQIGGLNSIFYILNKINNSYSHHFGEKTQYFFIEIFKILKNITLYDKENFIFSEIKNTLSYFSHFLFLIFKQNQHLANSRNSYFVESVFKFLMFFSSYFTKDSSIKRYAQDQVFQMELIFVKQLLCNFEIWSQCSIQIQSYVFLTLQSFIKNDKYIFAFFSIDLHAKILSAVSLFYTQQLNPLKRKFQQKILILCQQLYDRMLIIFDPRNDLEKFYKIQYVPYLINSLKKDKSFQQNANNKVPNKQASNFSKNKQKSYGEDKNFNLNKIDSVTLRLIPTKKQLLFYIDKYVHRDVNQSLSLIYSLILYHIKISSQINSSKSIPSTSNLASSRFQKYNQKQSIAKNNPPTSSQYVSQSFVINSSSNILPCEIKTCMNLINYFIKNFVQKQPIFSRIQNDWAYVLLVFSLLQQKTLQHLFISKQTYLQQKSTCQIIIVKIFQIIFKIVLKNQLFFNYIITFIQRIVSYQKISLKLAFQICTQIIHLNKKFNFDIYDTIFFLLNKKIKYIKNQCSKSVNLQSLEQINDEISLFLTDKEIEKSIYKMAQSKITFSKEFQQFLEIIYEEIQTLKTKKHLFQSQKNKKSFINEKSKQSIIINGISNIQSNANQLNLITKDNQNMSKLSSSQSIIVQNNYEYISDERELKSQQIQISTILNHDKQQINEIQIQKNSYYQNLRSIQKTFHHFEDILFEICYEMGIITSSNKQWIEKYFSKKYKQKYEQVTNQINKKKMTCFHTDLYKVYTKSNILKQKRINVQSNLKIAHYCSSFQTCFFIIDAVQRQVYDIQSNLIHQNSSIQKYQGNISDNKEQKNKNLSQPNDIETQQQINKNMSKLIHQNNQILPFYCANNKLSIETYYYVFQYLESIDKEFFKSSTILQKPKEELIKKQQNQNQSINNKKSQMSYKFLKSSYVLYFNIRSSLSILPFIYNYLYAKSFKYIFVKYYYNEQNQSVVQKPIQAIKRKQLTLKSLKMLQTIFQRHQIDFQQGLYYCLVNQNEVKQSSIINSNGKISEQQKKQYKKAIQTYQSNLKKFIQLWYINNNIKLCKANPHDKNKYKNPKKLNLSQKSVFSTIMDKFKFICKQIKTEQQKINELFMFLRVNTQGSDQKLFSLIFYRIILTLRCVIDFKSNLAYLEHVQKMVLKSKSNANLEQVICCPKNPYPLYTQKELQQYRHTLVLKFNQILKSQSKKSLYSQNQFKKIQKDNQFWLEIQQKDFTKKDQIFQLDQKQIGPFGFYKLNIRPSTQRFQQIQYPRKKIFSSIKSSSEEISAEDDNKEDQSSNSFLVNSRSRILDLSQIGESDEDYIKERRSTLLSSTITKKMLQKVETTNNPASPSSFLCQYVTKRGVYAIKLIIKPYHLQFRFLSHPQLPNQPVYRLSTGKFHQINQLTQQQKTKLQQIKIYYKRCKLFTRRYILRHTAIQLFQKIDHQSYFLNFFKNSQRQKFITQSRNKFQECIENKKQEFYKKQFTQQWKTGALSNFQYICLLNKYSGRSTNDLAQYYVFPWVISNYNGKNGFTEVNEQFTNKSQNMRNLANPPGKLNEEKFNKLKSRLLELDFCQPEQRFLYGTMFSNPTVLYNFFIRLQPFIHLHWEHQGKRIDHADRLFCGIQQQYNSVLIASSDMKQLTPQFYYWPQFLKNRSFIDLGQKQNKQQVDDVVLPVWAQSPQQFIFKMRYALQSYPVSLHLHEWIDLTFGYKIKYENAQQNDNLYHFNSYQRPFDYFQQFADDEKQIRSLQVSISQFGQIPEALFDEPHPIKNLRHQDLVIDRVINIKYERPESNIKNTIQQNKVGFQTCREGIFIWTNTNVEFKKSYITQNYSVDEDRKVFPSIGQEARLLSFQDQNWLTLNKGVLRMFNKKILKLQQNIESQILQIIGNYYIYSRQSSIYMDLYDMTKNKLINKKIIHGHKDQIIYIKCNTSLDIILSIDLEGFVMIHQLSNLAFMRNFQLPLQIQWTRKDFRSQLNNKNSLKVAIHQMGYFVFLINQKKLVIVTFLGETFLEHNIDIISQSFSKNNKKIEQQITDMVILRQDQSLLLLSTNRGNIYEVDFIQIKRYNQLYPYKIFTRIEYNILQSVITSTQKSIKKSTINTKQSMSSSQNINNISNNSSLNKSTKNPSISSIQLQKSIYKIHIQKIYGDKISFYQIICQYDDGDIVCFYEEKYLSKQLKQNEKLKQIGLFF